MVTAHIAYVQYCSNVITLWLTAVLLQGKVTTLHVIYTHALLPSSINGTSERAVMLDAWEGNLSVPSHWPCVTDLSGLSTYGLMA